MGYGSLEPGTLLPDPGTGLAVNVGDAVLGSNVDKFLNGVDVELGFNDKVLTNVPGAFDILIFEIGQDGDGANICDSRLGLSCLYVRDSDRISTGFTISMGQALTGYLIDLTDMGLAEGATISNLYVQGSGFELAAIAGVKIARLNDETGDVFTIPLPGALPLLLAGLAALGVFVRKPSHNI